MRHLPLLLTAALLAACQVAPQTGLAPRTGSLLRPVADGVTVTGRLVVPRRTLMTPPQQQRTQADVSSVEAYVRVVPPNSGYRLTDLPSCNEDPAPLGATLWTAATFAGGTPPTTLTLTGLPKDVELAVTLVAKDAGGAVISCHDGSTTSLFTTAGNLVDNAVTPAPLFNLQLHSGETYDDTRPVGLSVTPGTFLAPSVGPAAVQTGLLPPLVITTGVQLNQNNPAFRGTLDSEGNVSLLEDWGYSPYWSRYNAATGASMGSRNAKGSSNYSATNLAILTGTYNGAIVAYILAPSSAFGSVYGIKLARVDASNSTEIFSNTSSTISPRALASYNSDFYVVSQTAATAVIERFDPSATATLKVPANTDNAMPLNIIDAAVDESNDLLYVATTDNDLYRWSFAADGGSVTQLYEGSGTIYAFGNLAHDPVGKRLLIGDKPIASGKGTNSIYSFDLKQTNLQTAKLKLFAGPGDGTAATSGNQVYTNAYTLDQARFKRMLGIVPAADGSINVIDTDHSFSTKSRVRKIAPAVW